MVRRRGVGPWTLEAFPAEIGRSSALIVTEDESLISTSVAASGSASVPALEWQQSPSLPAEGRLRPPARPDSGGRGRGKRLGRVNNNASWGSRHFWEPPLRVLPWEGPRLLFSPVTEEPECEVPRSFLSLLGRGSPTGSCRGKLGDPTPRGGSTSGFD